MEETALWALRGRRESKSDPALHLHHQEGTWQTSAPSSGMIDQRQLLEGGVEGND